LFLSSSVIAVVLFEPTPIVGLTSEALLAIVFLFASLYFRKRASFQRYSLIFFALFVSSVVVVFRTVATAAVDRYLGGSSFVGSAAMAILVFLSTVLPIVILTKASRQSLSSIYLKKGNLRLGLRVGLVSLITLFFVVLVGFQLVYGDYHDIQFTTVLAVSPLVLIASALNASNEEMWFRGLFLKKYEPVFGRGLSNLLQAPVFMLAHVEMQYSQFGTTFFISFLLLVFFLGLILGYLMQKTDSMIGPTLVHIGADTAIFLPLLLSLVQVAGLK